MSYEQAPSTRMLYTHCLVCGRSLRDAISVQMGIGPLCRERCGLSDGDHSPNREACNKLIHQACQAVLENRTIELPAMIQAMQSLGFGQVAQRVSERFIPIRVVEVHEMKQDGGDLFDDQSRISAVPEYHLVVPFQEGFGHCLRRNCRNVSWDRTQKFYRLPATKQNQAALYQCLLQSFKGQVGYGKKGIFTLKERTVLSSG